MTRDPGQAWLDGRLVPWAEARLPVEDRGLQLGESLYEVVPVTHGRARLVAEHVERMAHGARALDLAGLPELEQWLAIAERLIALEGVEEGLLYAQLTGGVQPRRHLPEARPRPTFLAYLRPHRFPRQAEVERGLRAITVTDLRWQRCDLKTTMLLPAVLAKREAARRGVEEALLVGADGVVHEGASSTLHLVRSGRVVTSPSGPHILTGITRGAVAGLAAGTGIVVDETLIRVPDLLAADEVFVTATSLLLMPLVEVDGHPVGGGRAGPLSRQLAAALRASLELE